MHLNPYHVLRVTYSELQHYNQRASISYRALSVHLHKQVLHTGLPLTFLRVGEIQQLHLKYSGR